MVPFSAREASKSSWAAANLQPVQIAGNRSVRRTAPLPRVCRRNTAAPSLRSCRQAALVRPQCFAGFKTDAEHSLRGSLHCAACSLQPCRAQQTMTKQKSGPRKTKQNNWPKLKGKHWCPVLFLSLSLIVIIIAARPSNSPLGPPVWLHLSGGGDSVPTTTFQTHFLAT